MTELISLGPWRYGSYSGTLKLSYEIVSQNIQLNTTELKIKITFPGNREASNYGFICTVDGQSWDPGISKFTSSTSVTKTFNIKHSTDGTKTVSIYLSSNMSDDSGSDVKSATRSITLQQIPRGHRFVLDQTMLTEGKAVTITAIKSVNSYTSSISWNNGVKTGIVATNSVSNSWVVNYSTISNGLAKGVTRNVIFTFRTYNNTVLIATSTSSITVSTGKITLSLYDDGTDTGVTFGERAVKTGVNFKNGTVIDFGNTTVLGLDNVGYEMITATNLVGRKWANGFLEYFIDKYVPADRYTSWQGHYYRDYNVSIRFPTAFTNVLGAVAGYSNATCYSTQTRELSTTTAPLVRLMAFTNQSALTGYVHIYLWGYWK